MKIDYNYNSENQRRMKKIKTDLIEIEAKMRKEQWNKSYKKDKIFNDVNQKIVFDF